MLLNIECSLNAYECQCFFLCEVNACKFLSTLIRDQCKLRIRNQLSKNQRGCFPRAGTLTIFSERVVGLDTQESCDGKHLIFIKGYRPCRRPLMVFPNGAFATRPHGAATAASKPKTMRSQPFQTVPKLQLRNRKNKTQVKDRSR